MRARQRTVVAARMALSFTGEVTPQLVADICDQTGLHPSAFRTLFPTEDVLLDAVNDLLVDECAERLRTAVDNFRPPCGDLSDFVSASVALANAAPIDRGGLVIRARRRLNALRTLSHADAVAIAERHFIRAVEDTLADLMTKLGRSFAWPTGLAVRVILDTYERSFEAWMLAGNDEHRFRESSYVLRTLPDLLVRITIQNPSVQPLVLIPPVSSE